MKQLYPADILAWADRLGLSLWVVGDNIRYAPLEAATEEFVAALRGQKPVVRALLISPDPCPAELAESLDACLRLGQRLAAGKISALRCGITGQLCRHCQGVPCLGSQPLPPNEGIEEAG